LVRLNIDGLAYDLDGLSPEARQHIANINLVDQEIARLQVQTGIAQTARSAWLMPRIAQKGSE
jgi:hypothetical protein